MKFPEKCPYCGKDVAEKSERTNFFQSPAGNTYCSSISFCQHCHNPIFLLKKQVPIPNDSLNRANYELMYYLPVSTYVEYPERLKRLSPNAYKIYKQVCNAREYGLDTLLHSGLRIALEWLVWDFLIKIKNHTEKELEDLTLKNRLGLLELGDEVDVCADIIRYIGNDEVHVIKKFDFSREEAFEVYVLLLNLLESKLQYLEYKEKKEELKPSRK